MPAQRALRMKFSDGVEADYPYQYLRGYCPCALCQGHSALGTKYHEPAGQVEPSSIEAVGNYALSIAWSDGHSTGIYRFDFLREIEPSGDGSPKPDSE